MVCTKLSGAETVAFNALKEAIENHGDKLPETSVIPAGARGVYIQRWRETFYRKYGDDKSRDAAKKAFDRAIVNLQPKAHVGVSDPYAWIC